FRIGGQKSFERGGFLRCDFPNAQFLTQVSSGMGCQVIQLLSAALVRDGGYDLPGSCVLKPKVKANLGLWCNALRQIRSQYDKITPEILEQATESVFRESFFSLDAKISDGTSDAFSWHHADFFPCGEFCSQHVGQCSGNPLPFSTAGKVAEWEHGNGGARLGGA